MSDHQSTTATGEGLEPTLLTVEKVFAGEDVTYTVPIYQRNYAWRATQIEQLISDIQDAVGDEQDSYFLGNLIVTSRATATDFEVIDGQQRLTTLYLLLSYPLKPGSRGVRRGPRDRGVPRTPPVPVACSRLGGVATAG